jgi:hypothetical protein
VKSRLRSKQTLSVCTTILALSGEAWAREKVTAGNVQLTIGWGEEPAFAGSRNSISVEVSDASGAPLADPGARLSVEVTFGERRVALPLLPDGSPGHFRAWILPTRAGAYAFHIAGSFRSESIDITSACSEKTFPCVIDPVDIHFPEKDSTPAQLADWTARAQPRIDQALDDASEARRFSFAALALSLAALGVAVSRRARKSRK